MARMTFKAGDEYALKLSRLATGSDEIARKAIRAAADIVCDKIRDNLKANIDDPEYLGKKPNVMFKNMTNEPSGDLVDSLGITPIKPDKQGNLNAKIGFDGYDKRGVPNQLKARAMESGTSVMKKRPFVRPAVNATHKQAVEKMAEIINEGTRQIIK